MIFRHFNKTVRFRVGEIFSFYQKTPILNLKSIKKIAISLWILYQILYADSVDFLLFDKTKSKFDSMFYYQLLFNLELTSH